MGVSLGLGVGLGLGLGLGLGFGLGMGWLLWVGCVGIIRYYAFVGNVDVVILLVGGGFQWGGVGFCGVGGFGGV